MTADELGRLVGDLLRPAALVEVGVLAGCLLAAGLLLRALRDQAPPEPDEESIWFGRRIVDGLLFPLLTLLLALAARWMLADVLPLAVFRLAVPILVSLAAIRLTVRVLHSAFPDSRVVRNVERSVSWLAWIAVTLWISGVLPLMLQELDAIHVRFGATRVSVRNIIEGGVTAALVLVLSLWTSSALESRLLKGTTESSSIRKMAARALRGLLLFVGVLVAASTAGIDLTALSVLGGALGVGIGFGLQRLAANYVSGFVILAERSMRIGDVVKVDGFEGRISDISSRYTVIRALNGREAIVPNEIMITQRVENSTLADPAVLLTTTVQVAYGTDLDRLMPVLEVAAAAVPRVMAEPGPAVLLSNFVADGIELTIAFWIADPHRGQLNVRSDVNLAILRTLNAEGVEIPYPQRVVRQG